MGYPHGLRCNNYATSILTQGGCGLFKVHDSLNRLASLPGLKLIRLNEYDVSRFPGHLAKQLKKNGCDILYKTREIVNPYDDDRETVIYDFYTQEPVS